MLPIGGYVAAAMGVALLVSGAFGYWQYDRANGLQKSLAAERANVQIARDAVAEANATVKLMEQRIERVQFELEVINGRNTEILKEKDEANAKLNSYRDRIATIASKKPGLVGRFATRAVNGVMRDVQRTTDPDLGGKEDRGSGPVSSPASERGDTGSAGGAGADSGNDGRDERRGTGG